LSTFLLTVWARSLILGVFGLAAVALLRKRSASVRHAVAVSSLVAILALPFLGAIIRPQKVADLPPTVSMIVVPMATSPSLAARSSSYSETVRDTPSSDARAKAMLVLWLVGVGAGLIRVGRGLVALRSRIGKSETAPIAAHVPVLTHEDTTVPMTAWWGRHRIFLPLDWDIWPAEQLDTALRHEDAHIRRGDWFSRLGGQLVGVLFWPNPFALLLQQQAKRLAEQAADDLVIESGVAPWRYAQDLLQIARRAQAAAPMAAIQMADKAEVARRIEMVLEQNRTRRAVSPAGIFAIGLAVLALAIPMASWAVKPTQGTVQAAPVKGSAIVGTVNFQKGEGAQPKSNTSFIVTAKIYKSVNHVVLSPKTKAVPGSKADSMVIFTVPAGSDIPAITNIKEGDLISAPTLRTLDGMPATISYELTGDVTVRDVLTVEPATAAGGKIVLKISYVRSGNFPTNGGKISIQPVSVKLASGDTILLVNEGDPRTKRYGIIVIVQAKKDGSDKP
jgi:beta-lactamase regulating signal transducer with metallopeptidase domain